MPRRSLWVTGKTGVAGWWPLSLALLTKVDKLLAAHRCRFVRLPARLLDVGTAVYLGSQFQFGKPTITPAYWP